MKDLVRRQLVRSIATLQSVHDDPTLHDNLIEAASLTAKSLSAGGKLLVAGNGGSAADAQHLVAEFVVRLTVDRPALRAIALTTDSSILTAAGNDYGFDQIFARQIEALGQPGDIFLAISTSGNSPNILRALDSAKRLGLINIGLTGNDGGKMISACEHCIVIPSNSTANIQESHLVLEHIFCMLVERFTFGMDFDQGPKIFID